MPGARSIRLELPRAREGATAVDRVGHARDPARIFAEEEEHEGRDLLRLADAPDRMRGLRALEEPGIVGHSLGHGVEFGHDHARIHGVHSHAVRREVERRAARVHVHRRLAHAVRREVGVGPHPRDRREVHHAPLALDQLGRSHAREQEDRAQVRGHLPVPFGGRGLDHRARAQHARRVHEPVEPAEARDRLAHPCAARCLLAHVACDGCRLASVLPDARDHFVEAFPAPTGRHHARALAPQRARARAAAALLPAIPSRLRVLSAIARPLAIAGAGALAAVGALGLKGVAPAPLRWWPGLPGDPFTLGVDPLSAPFLLLLGVLAAVSLAARHSGPDEGRVGLALHVAFVLALAAVFTARHALLLLVAWEGMTLLSAALVARDTRSARARRAAYVYLVISH